MELAIPSQNEWIVDRFLELDGPLHAASHVPFSRPAAGRLRLDDVPIFMMRFNEQFGVGSTGERNSARRGAARRYSVWRAEQQCLD
jgi:hypothetical protein